jgi:hypothetical protein
MVDPPIGLEMLAFVLRIVIIENPGSIKNPYRVSSWMSGLSHLGPSSMRRWRRWRPSPSCRRSSCSGRLVCAAALAEIISRRNSSRMLLRREYCGSRERYETRHGGFAARDRTRPRKMHCRRPAAGGPVRSRGLPIWAEKRFDAAPAIAFPPVS